MRPRLSEAEQDALSIGDHACSTSGHRAHQRCTRFRPIERAAPPLPPGPPVYARNLQAGSSPSRSRRPLPERRFDYRRVHCDYGNFCDDRVYRFRNQRIRSDPLVVSQKRGLSGENLMATKEGRSPSQISSWPGSARLSTPWAAVARRGYADQVRARRPEIVGWGYDLDGPARQQASSVRPGESATARRGYFQDYFGEGASDEEKSQYHQTYG
jgi:hypothetical protein